MEQRYQLQLSNDNMQLHNNSYLHEQPMETNHSNQPEQVEQRACENHNTSDNDHEARSDLAPNNEPRVVDLDQAIDHITIMIKQMTQTSQTLKRLKFESLSTLVNLYSKIDIPLLVMDTLEREIFETLPRPESI